MQRDHTHEIDPAAPLTEQASFWWILLNEGEPSAADHRAFAEWVARSPERVEAYLQAARLTHALQSDQIRWPDTSVEDLIRAATAPCGEVTSLPVATGRGDGRPAGATRKETSRTTLAARVFGVSALTAPRLAGVLAAAIAALAAGLYFYMSPQRLETALGEQRSVVLSDGSIVTLNTSSAIEVHMERDHRTVKLLSGEALFEVAHDKARPFDVMTGDTTVRAVGTQFNVDRRPGGTTVTVVEGRVAVFTRPEGSRGAPEAKLPLEAGEQLTVAPRAARHPVHADVATAIAWTQRRLIFTHRQLGEVAAEFNRYNRQVIEIRSAELRNQEVTGVFQANDPASFLTFLSGLPGVSIESSADHSRFIVTQTATEHHAATEPDEARGT